MALLTESSIINIPEDGDQFELKILFLGHCGYCIVSNLAAAIRKNSEVASISVANILRPEGGPISKDELYCLMKLLSFITPCDERKELRSFLSDKTRELFC